MISVGSITSEYSLQDTLLLKHKKTVDWLSTAILMKKELHFFQKLLDNHASRFSDVRDKQKIDHFQNLILYYNGELIDTLSSKLRLHEKKLSEMLELKDETKTSYFKEHDNLMDEMESLYNQFIANKKDLFDFVGSTL